MHKKFEINWTKIKGGCQSGRKVVPHNSKSDLPLVDTLKLTINSSFTMQSIFLRAILIIPPIEV